MLDPAYKCMFVGRRRRARSPRAGSQPAELLDIGVTLRKLLLHSYGILKRQQQGLQGRQHRRSAVVKDDDVGWLAGASSFVLCSSPFNWEKFAYKVCGG